ncbi:MAG: hypothetical protein Salg2KO_22610 [Salibacteraceae bacterium]
MYSKDMCNTLEFFIWIYNFTCVMYTETPSDELYNMLKGIKQTIEHLQKN